MLNRILRLAAPLSLLPGLAQAHPGHDSAATFSLGLLHPLSGADHLLVMLAMGLWAARLGKSAYTTVAAAYLGLLLAGACLSQAGAPEVFAAAQLELGLATSVLVGGVCLLLMRQLPTAAGISIFGTLALLQGYAHGAEMPVQADLGSYLAGLSLGSVSLYSAGLCAAVGLLRSDSTHTIRWMGGAMLAAGATLLLS